MGKGVVRPKKLGIPTNTLELMRGSGLKYMHALKKGKQGLDADLEKCKQALLADGHVFAENFEDDSSNSEVSETRAPSEASPERSEPRAKRAQSEANPERSEPRAKRAPSEASPERSEPAKP